MDLKFNKFITESFNANNVYKLFVLSLFVFIIQRYFVLRDDFVFMLFTLSPFFVVVLLIFLFQPRKKAYKKDKVRVKLRYTPAIGGEEWFDLFIEQVIFGRTENFKNDAAGNIFLIKAAYTVSIITIAVVFVSFFIFSSIYPISTTNLNITYLDILKGYLAAFAAINGLYWLEKNKYKEKWGYLSQGYNRIITTRDYTKPLKPLYMDAQVCVLLNALALDILVSMMWSHRSFKELFLDEALKAVKHISHKPDESKNELLNFHFSETELQFILENYQLEIMGLNSVKVFDISRKGNWLNQARLELENIS